MDQNPYNLPTVLDWSDERRTDDVIMVTLAYGWAFEAGESDFDGSHVRGFRTVTEAKRGVAKKRLEKCECPRCANGLMRQEIDSALAAPENDGFMSDADWLQRIDMTSVGKVL